MSQSEQAQPPRTELHEMVQQELEAFVKTGESNLQYRERPWAPAGALGANK